MPFLKLQADTDYELEVHSAKPEERRTHFIGGRSYPCDGDGCKYCMAQFEQRIEGLLEVTHNGSPFTWSFPITVLLQLREYPGFGKGSRLHVRKSGAGQDTRYTVAVLNAGPPTPPPPQEVAGPRASLSAISGTLRQIADDLDRDFQPIPLPDELPF